MTAKSGVVTWAAAMTWQSRWRHVEAIGFRIGRDRMNGYPLVG